MKCLRPCSPTPAWWSSESASTASAWAHSTKAHSISTPPQTPTQYELRRRPRKRQRQPLHLGNHRRCLETLDRHKRLCASGHLYIRSGHWHRDRNTAAGKTVSAIISLNFVPSDGLSFLFGRRIFRISLTQVLSKNSMTSRFRCLRRDPRF